MNNQKTFVRLRWNPAPNSMWHHSCNPLKDTASPETTHIWSQEFPMLHRLLFALKSRISVKTGMFPISPRPWRSALILHGFEIVNFLETCEGVSPDSGKWKMKSENCPKMQSSAPCMQTHHATTWALKYPERGEVPLQSNWSNCSSLASASSWKARLQWWDCKGSGSLWSKPVAGEDYWYLRMIHSYVTLFQHGIRRDHTKCIYIYIIYIIKHLGHPDMFCGPSATPWSPPPSSGKTSPNAPSGSSDPGLLPRSLESPVVMLSSGSCTPQTVEAKNVSKLSTHLDNCLHLTSSSWHCHPWQSHHRTRRISKASPFQLFTSDFLDQLLNCCEVSPTHRFIDVVPIQPAFCGWHVEYKKPAKASPNVQKKSPNTPNGIKRIKLAIHYCNGISKIYKSSVQPQICTSMHTTSYTTTAFIVGFCLIHLGLGPVILALPDPHGTLNPFTLASRSLSVCATFTSTSDAARAAKGCQVKGKQLLPWSRLETCRVCLQTTSLGMRTTSRCRTFMVTEGIKMKPQFELWTKRYPWCLEVGRNKCQKIHWNTSRDGFLLPKEAMERLRLVRNRGWGTGWKLDKVGISEFADLVRQHAWWAQTPGQERVSEPKVAMRHTEASHQCLSFFENAKSPYKPYKIVDLVAMFPKLVAKLLGELKAFLKVRGHHHTYAKDRCWILCDPPLIPELAAANLFIASSLQYSAPELGTSKSIQISHLHLGVSRNSGRLHRIFSTNLCGNMVQRVLGVRPVPTLNWHLQVSFESENPLMGNPKSSVKWNF